MGICVIRNRINFYLALYICFLVARSESAMHEIKKSQNDRRQIQY